MPKQNIESWKDFVRVYRVATGHDLPRDASILVFGAGKGALSMYLRDQGYSNVRAIDREEQGVPGVERGRIENERGRYDVLVGLNVFDSHHYPSQTRDVQEAMVEGVFRALKPDGFLLSNGDIVDWAGRPFDGYVLDYDHGVGVEGSAVTEAIVLRKLKAL